MLGNPPYYFGSIQKYIALFGTLFNDIIITRSIAGETTQMINVPVSYAGKEKLLSRVKQDAAINRPDSIILPALSFEVVDMTYAKEDKLQSTGMQTFNLSNSNINFNYNPVPYDLHFKLYIYFKNREDGAKILEQILPFFTPVYTAKAFMIPGLPTFNIPVILEGISMDENVGEDFKQRPVYIWSLGFTLKGKFYGPTRTSPVINLSEITISVGDVPTQNVEYKIFGLEDLADYNE